MLGFPQGVAPDWRGASPSAASCIMKKILRLEVPVDAYPKVGHILNFNLILLFVDWYDLITHILRGI